MSRRLAVSLGVLALAAPAGAATPPADLVLKNAIVHTVDAKRPRAEAVAVRANRIVAVGANADVLPLVGPRTRVLDLAGRTVVPGFDDSHAHMLGSASRGSTWTSWGRAATPRWSTGWQRP